MKKRLRKKLLKKEIERLKKYYEYQSRQTSLIYSFYNPDCKIGDIIKIDDYNNIS